MPTAPEPLQADFTVALFGAGELGTVKHAALFLDCSERQIWEWEAKGELGCARKGRWVRFGEDHLMDFWFGCEALGRGTKPRTLEAERRQRQRWRAIVNGPGSALEQRVAALEAQIRAPGAQIVQLNPV